MEEEKIDFRGKCFILLAIMVIIGITVGKLHGWETGAGAAIIGGLFSSIPIFTI